MTTRIDPPIPLPEFDPYEQLGKARDRIAELEGALRQIMNMGMSVQREEHRIARAALKGGGK